MQWLPNYVKHGSRLAFEPDQNQLSVVVRVHPNQCLLMLQKICNLLSDVCGLVKTVFAVKFVTFIDDATCHNWIYLSY